MFREIQKVRKMINQPAKAGNLSTFKHAIDAVEESKNNKLSVEENLENTYQIYLNKGKDLFIKAMQNIQKEASIEYLRQSSLNFLKCSEIKKERPEPYFMLANAFSLIGENEYAMNYLKIVTYLEPEYPGLQEFKESFLVSNFNNQAEVSQVIKQFKPKSGNERKPVRMIRKIS